MKRLTNVYIVFLGLMLLLVSCRDNLTTTNSNSNINSAPNLQANHKAKPEKLNNVSVSVFATGLNYPRGLKFGPDGYLYVAEAGVGGTNSTSSSACEQVPVPIGPYSGSITGSRISRINSSGVRTTYVDNLPSSQTSLASGNLTSGVADVAFIGNTLYAILAGAGCSHGVPSIPNGIIRIKPNKTWTMIANLSAWQQSHPVANPEEEDFEPDGTWYSMINVRGNLYAIEPNHGEMVRVTPSGHISRVIDVSASQGHIVPTVVAYHGNFFIGNLNTFPIVQGSSDIFKVTPSGRIKVWATGFTTILGILVDQQRRIYVLENTTGEGNMEPTPNTGKIIRLDNSGHREVIASGLNLPTGMTFGPDGNIYVSVIGFGPPANAGSGEILKITL
ncbi:MAG TPA: ScyD/ScyE family protein [Balneolales bacterium]|nr:ScyD/ScyE family protein [Balneolales bacterium]